MALNSLEPHQGLPSSCPCFLVASKCTWMLVSLKAPQGQFGGVWDSDSTRAWSFFITNLVSWRDDFIHTDENTADLLSSEEIL